MTQLEKEQALFLLKKEQATVLEPLRSQVKECHAGISEYKQRLDGLNAQIRHTKLEYAEKRNRINQMPVEEGVWAKAKRIFQQSFQRGVESAAAITVDIKKGESKEEGEL